ncbi:Got1-domain-containing protein [Sanghuangporus baumii]|uniref:Got1-domain-containing protein n=1 Tax=Sanghuangporus baumii TaxID=108892 RepID=A0A9Q5N5A3_SANBA|nr:Got1-domain-containing protein [Sanghuangporus baumii]
MWLTDAQKIGVALTSFGVLFMLLGVVLFFDGSLLALGNVLFLSGITLIIGARKTFYFFARKQKLRGTICFFGGVILVFLKWPFVGVVIETFGFLNLFGDFFPVILTFLRQLPFVGTLLSLPYIRDVADRLAGSRQPGCYRLCLEWLIRGEFKKFTTAAAWDRYGSASLRTFTLASSDIVSDDWLVRQRTWHAFRNPGSSRHQYFLFSSYADGIQLAIDPPVNRNAKRLQEVY